MPVLDDYYECLHHKKEVSTPLPITYAVVQCTLQMRYTQQSY